ncbi:MtN3 and saliva related transmembrane protein [Tistlia consotensis]|uniref:MtN3 and saliva related transmembrane protein n=1 Tax=Tistlia consotensis USBA 355 TaxID=560819 RepID=A0A1Y6BRK8_9PROT|nr:SemiSWEET transporter [Tistlia consotensis]SMF16317.1 MtN3 and saliva related transmembrane protein [Tistlia consotensis USBA 355]SNR41213.1 MtN3 and saliva related transmembrane protein [Tistlia consotensis]
MTLVTLVGLAAGTCTTAAFLPQALKAWRTRQTRDLSLSMFLVFVTGIVLWLAYGLILGDVPIVVANALTLLLAGSILALKLRHG